MATTFDVREEIESAAISRFHWKLGTLIGIIMFFDGYELFNAAYAIPLILKSWHPGPTDIGMMLSSGIVGLSIGSILQGVLADRFGRRKVMLCALYGLGLASLSLAAIADSPLTFAGFRLCLGTALGMITPLVIAYINEWAPRRSANVYTIWVFQFGFSLGGIMAGAAGAVLAPSFGWQAIYYAGALSILVAVAAQAWLPESAQYLAARRDFTGIGRILGQLHPARRHLYHDAQFTLAGRAGKPSVRILLQPPYRARTLAAWLSGALSLFCIHGLTGWLPTLLVQRGEAMSSAAAYGTMIMTASLFGGLGSGWLADRVKSRVVAMVVWFALAALSLLALGYASGPFTMMALVAAAGFFVFGGQSVQNNFIASIYPTEVRSTGVGLAVAINRIGGMLGPVVIGFVKSIDPDPIYTFDVLAAAMFLACLSFIVVRGERAPAPQAGALQVSLSDD
ncbi:MFS transporter [uncultured Massilia sp.]|uniref:MFS transporter n=1 Tax=uncultured Massilia sp. TaxID=169973 RepID=UPI0025D59DE1|nr:MFS transporter [uncultured Massilia sp.]